MIATLDRALENTNTSTGEPEEIFKIGLAQKKWQWPFMALSVGTAVLQDTVLDYNMVETPIASSIPLYAGKQMPPIVLMFNPGKQKLSELLKAHFTEEGREARINKSLKALEEATIPSKIDLDTLNWIVDKVDAGEL
jgi:hypothetical protein